jgi:hypothetical protein
MMKRSFVPVLAIIILITSSDSAAQYYYQDSKYYGADVAFELGGSMGIMNSLTDLGGKKGLGKKFIKDLNWKVSRPSFSFYGMVMYKEAFGVRLEATFGNIHAYDSILKDVAPSTFGRYERNLSFRSTIREFQLAAEIHPLFFKSWEENEAPFWSPYLVAGIGYFSFDPQAKLNGRWYSLHPLHTEGQGFSEYPDRKPYKLNQVNVPLGLGMKYEINSFINARLEFVHRLLFTDYLDDVSTDNIDPLVFYAHLSPGQAAVAEQLADRRYAVPKSSQRGDRRDNDAYFTIHLKLGVTLRHSRRN